MNGQSKETLSDVAARLSIETGGETRANYVPTTDTLLLKMTGSCKAIKLATCNTLAELLRAFEGDYKISMMPPVVCELVGYSAMAKTFDDNLKLGMLIDIKQMGLVSPKRVVKQDLDVEAWLRDFKLDNRVLVASARHTNSTMSATGKKNKASLILPNTVKNMNKNEGSEGGKIYQPSEIITLSFHVITEYHNVSGIYTNPELIDG